MARFHDHFIANLLLNLPLKLI